MTYFVIYAILRIKYISFMTQSCVSNFFLCYFAAVILFFMISLTQHNRHSNAALRLWTGDQFKIQGLRSQSEEQKNVLSQAAEKPKQIRTIFRSSGPTKLGNSLIGLRVNAALRNRR